MLKIIEKSTKYNDFSQILNIYFIMKQLSSK